MHAEPVITQNAQLRGLFAGFVRTLLGKRRMLLHRDGDELLLKVPKELRRVLEGRLSRGQEVIVWGEEEIEKRSAETVFTVSNVQTAGLKNFSRAIKSPLPGEAPQPERVKKGCTALDLNQQPSD